MSRLNKHQMSGGLWSAMAVRLLPAVWFTLFFVAPFLIVIRISFSTAAIAQPPYLPHLDNLTGLSDLFERLSTLVLDNYSLLFADELYLQSYGSSVLMAAQATIITLFIGYPFAYSLARAPKRWRYTLLILTILPFWTSFLIRVYAWIGILKRDGLVNTMLLDLGVISEPLALMNNNFAVQVGIVYTYLPFMVLPLYAALERQDLSLPEAAADLGASPWTTFLSVTLPLSLPGVVAGCMLVFIPATGEYVIPALLGGSDTLMIGKTLWIEFFNNRDWPVASAAAVLLLLLLIFPIVLLQRSEDQGGQEVETRDVLGTVKAEARHAA